MRMYTKNQLTLINGYLKAPDSSIVVIDPEVAAEANALETMLQKAEYLQAQPAATPMPSLDGFERKSIMDDVVPQFTVTTPMLDRKAKDALAIMDELDNMDTTESANQMLQLFAKLFEFVKSTYVIDHSSNGTELVRIDTPTLGNILELTEADIVDAVAKCNGLTKRSKDDNDDDLDELESLLDKITRAAEDDIDIIKTTIDTIKADDDAMSDIAKALADEKAEIKLPTESEATED